MKHIDEHYKDWCGESHTFNSGVPTHDSAEACDFAQYYAKELLSWNSVKDRLPNNITSVIVRDNGCSPIRSTALFQDGKFHPDFLLKHENVTHWRLIDPLA